MKKLFAISLILFLFAGTLLKAQQAVLKPVDEKITPGMTEIWDPEVKVIQPEKSLEMHPLMPSSCLMAMILVWSGQITMANHQNGL